MELFGALPYPFSIGLIVKIAHSVYSKHGFLGICSKIKG
jgi:hypothetical protein